MNTVKIEELDFQKGGGLLPVIVQDYVNGRVLMLGYADKVALLKTIETGYAHFWSRSRKKLWMKGETSGNYLKVIKIMVDCDSDTILYISEPHGPTCHTGNISCFFRDLKGSSRLEREYSEPIIEEIVSYFEKCKIIRRRWIEDVEKGYYEYIVEPISTNMQQLSLKAITWTAHKINYVTLDDIDKVIIPDSSAMQLGFFVAQLKKKPMSIVNGLHDDRHDNPLYDVSVGEKILLINNIAPNKEEMSRIEKYLKERGVTIVDAASILENGEEGETAFEIKTLIKIWKEEEKIYSITNF